MNVILIGEHTYGKNVGSFTITDNAKRWNYGLQPITFKILNALDQSDYGSVNGFYQTMPLQTMYFLINYWATPMKLI